MNNQEVSLKNFADNMLGPDDERKATCIHCGAKWYEIHFKDGVCHSCQEKKLPGRKQLARTERTQRLVLTILAVASVIVFLLLYF